MSGGNERKSLSELINGASMDDSQDEKGDGTDSVDNLLDGDLIGNLSPDTDSDFEGVDISGLHETLKEQNELLEEQSSRQQRQFKLTIGLMVFHTVTLAAVYYTATSREWVAVGMFIAGMIATGAVFFHLRDR
ncbi:hypothetical protein [Saliphagus sp. LR7]|uniref:hypothetical protein n=1 Tax=Saliphagus sp. LR7 TaxID=2282654 RepID=UPI0013007A81|nr:hypothetical protein [Saliphagus sp. LR7]